VCTGGGDIAAQNIRQLENKLDKASVKLGEAQAVKATYEVLLTRLRDEQVGFRVRGLGADQGGAQVGGV